MFRKVTINDSLCKRCNTTINKVITKIRSNANKDRDFIANKPTKHKEKLVNQWICRLIRFVNFTEDSALHMDLL